MFVAEYPGQASRASEDVGFWPFNACELRRRERDATRRVLKRPMMLGGKDPGGKVSF